MDLGPPLVADEQPPEVVEPGEGALNDPAVASEPGAVRVVAVRDQWLDPTLAQRPPIRGRVVAAVTDQRLRPAARTADQATDCWHRFDERQ